MTLCRVGSCLELKDGTFYIYILAVIRYSNVTIDGFRDDVPFSSVVAFAGRDGC